MHAQHNGEGGEEGRGKGCVMGLGDGRPCMMIEMMEMTADEQCRLKVYLLTYRR